MALGNRHQLPHADAEMALALHRRLIVVGPHENVFHLLPEATRADTWSEALDLVRQLSDVRQLADAYLVAVFEEPERPVGVAAMYEGADTSRRDRRTGSIWVTVSRGEARLTADPVHELRQNRHAAATEHRDPTHELRPPST